MENRTKPSPSPHPLPRGEGERANASSTIGEYWLRSHASKLGPKAARPPPARPNALAHSALPDEPSGSPSPLGRGLGWVARIDMGNTLSTHMGNTSIVCREISPVPQELLHTSSQAPKGPIDGVCDEVCSSSASRKKCVAGPCRAQKVLPMSMPTVLPMSMPGAVRGKGLACRLRLSFQPLAPVLIPPKLARNQFFLSARTRIRQIAFCVASIN